MSDLSLSLKFQTPVTNEGEGDNPLSLRCQHLNSAVYVTFVFVW